MNSDAAKVGAESESALLPDKEKLDQAMVRKRVVVGAVIIFGGPLFLMLLFSLWDYSSLRTLYRVEFTTMSGQVLALEQYEGKVLVVVVVAALDPKATEILSEYQELFQVQGFRGAIEVVGITDPNLIPFEQIRPRYLLLKVGFPILYPSVKAARALAKYRVLPSTLILDRSGRVLVHHQGRTDIGQVISELRVIVDLEQ